MRRLARLLPYLAILAVLLIAAVVLLHFGPVNEHIRNAIATELSSQLDRKVVVGKVSLSLTGRVVLRNIVIRNKSGAPFADIPEAVVTLGKPGNRLSLILNPTDIRDVRVLRPKVTIRRSASGRFDIADLFIRKRPKPSRFRGTITVQDGHITLVDETHAGLVSALDAVNASVRYPRAGRTAFRVTAESREGAFDALDVDGESDSGSATTKVSGRVKGLSIPYAIERAPRFAFMDVEGGRADVEGKLTVRNSGRTREMAYDVSANVAEARVSFPWLRRPVEGVSGKVQFIDGDVRLRDMKGTVAEAPVQASGIIRNVRAPQLDLDITATGIRYPQLKALLPRVAFPAGLMLPSPVRVNATVEGPVSAVIVKGQATVRVIKFRVVPWHDVVGKFEYSRGKLKITGLRASGSPRSVAADILVDLVNQRPLVEAEVELTDVPVTVLTEMAGIELPGVTGTADITAAVRASGRQAVVTGHANIRRAAVGKAPLGNVHADFRYSDDEIKITRGVIEGPTAKGTFSADIRLPGAYRAHAGLSTVDVAAAAPALGASKLRGRFPAAIDVWGKVPGAHLAGSVKLGPGEVQGRDFRGLAADVSVSPQEIRVSGIDLQVGAGRYLGDLVAQGWEKGPAETRLSGSFSVENACVSDWLAPEQAKAIPRITLTGSPTEGRGVEVSGTLASPAASVNLAMEVAPIAGAPASSGVVRADYSDHRLTLKEVSLTQGRTRLRAEGGYSPETGLAITVMGDPIDLGVFAEPLRSQYGIALTGLARLEVSATGRVSNPTIAFTFSCDSVVLNDVPLTGVDIAGQFAAYTLRLMKAEAVLAQGKIAVSGTISLVPVVLGLAGPGRGAPATDLAVALDGLDLRTLALIGEGVVNNIYTARPEVFAAGSDALTYLKAYARMRPVGGTLSTQTHVSGSVPAGPQVDVRTLRIDDLSLRGERVGVLSGALELTHPTTPTGGSATRITIPEIEIARGPASAALTGTIEVGGNMELSVSTRNLDLSLFSPWFPMSGAAQIDFDIAGPVKAPAIEGGSVTMEHVTIGPLKFENVRAGPITMEGLLLTVRGLDALGEQAPGSAAPALSATGEFSLPLEPTGAAPSGELHVRNVRFVPLDSMAPLSFDADVYLRPNTHGALLDFHQLPQTPQQGEVQPGVRGTAGAGSFSVAGDVFLPARSPRGLVEALLPSNLDKNVYDLTATLHHAQIEVPGIADARLDGELTLKTLTPGQPPTLEAPASQPIILSDSTFGVPEHMPTIRAAESFPFHPDVEVWVAVGSNVWFRYGSPQRPTQFLIAPARFDGGKPTMGYLEIDGRLAPRDLTLDGAIATAQGQLAFPNGILTVTRGTAYIERQMGQGMTIDIAAEAHGRVGDYAVTLNPSGRVYPPGGPPLELNAMSYPYLDEVFLMALLAGPMVSPTLGAERSGVGQLLSQPGRASGAPGEITGAMVPFGSALGIQHVSLDLSIQGPVRLRLTEPLFGSFVVSYTSLLTGPSQKQAVRINYQIGPTWTIGYGVNELERSRWDVAAFFPF